MQVSYSRVGCYKQCPHQFKLRYIDGLKTFFNNDPVNPLVIGTALHTGIEKDAKTAIKEYYDNYPIIDDKNVEEAIKLECMIEKCREILPEGEHEVLVETNDYKGYLDLLVPVGGNQFDLYDFKYSNNVDRYMESAQLHVYKYYFERTNLGLKIRKMFFVFAPKVSIRKKYKNKTNSRDETVEEFRTRLRAELRKKDQQIVEVVYNIEKVKEFLRNAKECRMATQFPKNPTRLCDWCEFHGLCQNGDDLEIDWDETPYKDYDDYIKHLKG